MVDKSANLNSELDTLMSELGYILLEGSLLERAVLNDIKRLRMVDGDSGETSIRTRGVFSERLAEWRALVSLKSRRNPAASLEVGEIASQAERLCRTRNLLTHHFAGVETSEDEKHHILVSEAGISALRASQIVFTSAQLNDVLTEMRDVRRRIARLKDILAN